MSAAMDELGFIYFPGHYRWSHGMLLALNAAPWGGAEIGEVHRVGLELKDKLGDDAAWFAAWAAAAARLEERGRALAVAGRRLSAAQYLMRAANYAHVGERFLQPKSAPGLEAYRRGVKAFADGARLLDRPRIESVEVPYEGKSLPALLVQAAPERTDGRPAPAMVFFDGFDVTKEIQYFKGVPDLAARGIACLIVDGPGNGESIRFRGLALHHETERYATAALDYLARRGDIDGARIGVMAISLGGYFAARAAAMEPRFACCIAWGAIWDYHATWHERLERLARNEALSLSVPWEHLLWTMGAASKDEALKKLEGFRLEGVAQRIACPFLLVHGEGDAQIPLAIAERVYEAVGSTRKELKVFTRAEGGYHHCQSDNLSIGTAYMWDWAAEALGAG